MKEDNTVLLGCTGATPVRPGQPGRSTKVRGRLIEAQPGPVLPAGRGRGVFPPQGNQRRTWNGATRNGPKGQDQKSAAGDHQCLYTRASCGPCVPDRPPSAQTRPKAHPPPPPSLQGWTQPRAHGHFRQLGDGVETFKPNVNS